MIVSNLINRWKCSQELSLSVFGKTISMRPCLFILRQMHNSGFRIRYRTLFSLMKTRRALISSRLISVRCLMKWWKDTASTYSWMPGNKTRTLSPLSRFSRGIVLKAFVWLFYNTDLVSMNFKKPNLIFECKFDLVLLVRFTKAAFIWSTT